GVYGPVNVNSHYVMRQSSLYGAARFQVSDKLKLITGTRIVSHDYKFDESWSGGTYATATSEDGVFTPYAGVVYDINREHAVYASYTTIYQPQSARDRNGAVLDPTEGANYEVGLKSAWLDGRLNTALALYQIRQDNVAEADPGYFVPGTMDTGASRSVKGTRTQGLDLEVFGALARDWNVSASWTYSQSETADGARTKTTFPRNMVKLWTTYRLPGEWSRLTLGGGVNWQSKTYSTVTPWQLGRALYW
ncbi:MAG: TonB-dependent receptor, partial [Comamonas sp.]